MNNQPFPKKPTIEQLSWLAGTILQAIMQETNEPAVRQEGYQPKAALENILNTHAKGLDLPSLFFVVGAMVGDPHYPQVREEVALCFEGFKLTHAFYDHLRSAQSSVDNIWRTS